MFSFIIDEVAKTPQSSLLLSKLKIVNTQDKNSDNFPPEIIFPILFHLHTIYLI